MIKIQNLKKRYAQITAVDDLNLTIQEGEIFGFIGPNGAGKTTTIKMMGGILAPTSGSVMICGINMGKDPENAKRRIGFIPDRPYLYEKLTGMEFLRFISGLYGLDPSQFQKKAETYLELFSLTEWSHDLIESYSHGMRQRLIMASAFLHEPQVIIVDEPMVGLDPMAVVLVKNLFKRFAEKGRSIFMSTHSLHVAQDLCHRIGIIHKGKLIAVGTLDELRQNTHHKDADLEKVFMALTIQEEHNPGAGAGIES
ncbi:MAG: ABC transporter ATP-binding protein [Thermodesulfobacteriota bacterium]